MQKMKNRVIRADDELWGAVQATAEQEGTTVSAIVRRLLSAYVRAGAAVLVAVVAMLTLGACGAQDGPTLPAADRTPVAATSAPQATTEAARGHGADKCETAEEITALWQALPTMDAPADVRLTAWRDLLAVIPANEDACTDDDRNAFNTFRESLIANLDDLEHPNG